MGQPNSQVAVSWAVGNHIIKHNQGTQDLEDQIIESCKNGGNQTVEKGAFNVKNLQKLNHGLRKQWSVPMVEGNPSNLGTTCYETATQNHRWIHPRIIVAMNIPFKNVQNQSMNTLIYFELPIRVYQVCCIHWPFVVVKYPKSKNVGKIRHLLVFLHSYCWGKSGFTATNAPVSPFVHCQIYNFYQFLDDQPKKRLPTPCFNFKSTIFHGHLPIVSTHPFRLTKKTHRSIHRRTVPRSANQVGMDQYLWKYHF